MSVKPIRILLLGMPTMLRQILRQTAASVPGLIVVAELPDAELDSPDVIAAGADVVIAGADRASEAAVTDLLCRPYPVQVLGISADGHDAVLYEMRPHRMLLEELSPTTLVSVLSRQRRRSCP